MQTPENPFLHDGNPHTQMHASDEVEVAVDYLRGGEESIPTEPANKVAAYLGFLANRDHGVNFVQELRRLEPEMLEPEMIDIAIARLKELPDRELPEKEQYIREAEDMKRLAAIEKKITANPDIDLTGEEVRFLYELDHEIQGFGYETDPNYETDPRIGEIRKLRGESDKAESDKAELARILPESIREHLKSAFTAYNTVAEQLGGIQRLVRKGEPAISLNELEHLFDLKDREWQENGVYDYLVEQLIENGVRYNLVATPNVEASGNQIVSLAVKFGKGQPINTHVYNKLFRRGRYTGREWSGNEGNAPVRLSLIPDRPDGQISGNNVEQQVRMLEERQTQLPELNARVPSLLDAVTYWYVLRAKGDKLNGYSARKKTYIRHFDLEPKAEDWRLLVPRSYVQYGWPCLDSSFATAESSTRIAVG
ncbi:MAG: hypothetical protein WDZ81_01370 [Candidatus Saccharimonadales bacterium]